MRIALGIEYDGTAYNGWQRQKTGSGVQELVEASLGKVANHTVEVYCAGRTDTGVHAAGQVVHFDSPSQRSMRSWLLGANSDLPDDISVCWAQPVPDDFHARYSATARTYRYLILNRLVRSALYRRQAWWLHETLDHDSMQAASLPLLGEHDFSAFRAAGCQASSPNRDLRVLDVMRRGDWIDITVTANAVLQHMVRNIVGLLVAIGRGDRPPSWAKAVLEGRDRTTAAAAAPAHGLTLIGADYPARFGLPKAKTPDLLPGLG